MYRHVGEPRRYDIAKSCLISVFFFLPLAFPFYIVKEFTGII